MASAPCPSEEAQTVYTPSAPAHSAPSEQVLDRDRKSSRHAIPGSFSPHPHRSRGPPSRTRINRRARVDRITEALSDAGHSSQLPRQRPSYRKLDLSHTNVRSRTKWVDHRDNSARHRDDPIPRLAQARETKLSRILASYIQHREIFNDSVEAARSPDFRLQPQDEAIMKARGYTLDDLHAWAEIVLMPDSLKAATALAARIDKAGVSSVPFFLVAYVLRRETIRAGALPILVRAAWQMLNYHTSSSATHALPSSAIFITFVRLVRHARVVWSASLDNMVQLLLQFLPRTSALSRGMSRRQLDELTFQLNKAMRLIAMPTSVEPYKNSHAQEVAIVRILRFMAEHDPPIDIIREGYRAVALVQLAQPKSAGDRQWAELKALSWPPWKEERTAMDADFTRDTYGLSKAAQTLMRMYEAGYAPGKWEETAGIYAGWDQDLTPTIQSRVLLGTNSARFESGAASWAARITATRTTQEAWACYEAYEKENHATQQDVLLATLKKLHEEERRKGVPDGRVRSAHHPGQPQLLPGDAREVEPLPPSTHLYTYTSRPPPSIYEFHEHLRQRHVAFEGHCLAFILAKAASLRQGLAYLHDNLSTCPSARTLLNPDYHDDISTIDIAIYASFLQLCSRFSKVPFSSALPTEYQSVPRPLWNKDILANEKLNANHTLVLAIDLLRRRRPTYRPAWNSVLRALGHESSLANLWSLHSTDRSRALKKRLSDEVYKWCGAMVAYRLTQRVLEMIEQTHLDLDTVGLTALCQATENMVFGCWTIMRLHHTARPAPTRPHLLEAVDLIGSPQLAEHLKREFQAFIGDDDNSNSDPIPGLDLPRLLHVPSAAVLHAYIRSLGWLADYGALLDLLRWMVEFQAELTEQRARDRNGEVIMRRALVAMRVFMEREWLPEVEAEPGASLEPDAVGGSTVAANLKRLSTPASDELIAQAADLVDSVADWGGRPTDEEVEAYCDNERFKRFG